MKTTQENILQYLKELKPSLKALGIEEVALFGSFAKNKESVYSDIDIAIRKDKDFLKNHTPYEYFEALNYLRAMIHQKLHRQSDIFDLDSQSSFKESIQKELIYV